MTLVATRPPSSSAPDDPTTARLTRAAGGHARWWDAALWITCVALSVTRVVTLASTGAPSGIDGGHWLAQGRALVAYGPWSSNVTYPPLVPFFTLLANHLLGDTLGIAFVAALCAAAPALAVRHVVRPATRPAAATATGLLTLGAVSIGDQAAWGAFPQLLGVALALLALHRLDASLRARRSIIPTALLFASVAYTSHLELLSLCFASVVLIAIHRRSDGPHARTLHRAAQPLALAGLIAAPLIVIYWRLTTAVLGSQHAEPAISHLHWTQLPHSFADTFPSETPIWCALLLAAVAAPLAFRRHAPRLSMIATASLIGVLASLAITREPRYLYDLVVPVALAFALWSTERPRTKVARHLVGALGAATVIIVVITGARAFPGQHDHYQMLTPAMHRDFAWLDAHLPHDARVAVSPLDGQPLGWWAEAITQRPTITAAPLRWLEFRDERRHAHVADTIFLPGPLTTTQRVALARKNGIRYLVDARHDVWYPNLDTRELTQQHHVVLQDDALLVVDLEHDAP